MALPIVVRAPTMASNSVRRVRHVWAYVSSSALSAAMSSCSLLIVLSGNGAVRRDGQPLVRAESGRGHVRRTPHGQGWGDSGNLLLTLCPVRKLVDLLCSPVILNLLYPVGLSLL